MKSAQATGGEALGLRGKLGEVRGLPGQFSAASHLATQVAIIARSGKTPRAGLKFGLSPSRQALPWAAKSHRSVAKTLVARERLFESRFARPA
jgi:hypothetical protein